MFEKKKILVAGDFMLDIYTYGKVERISPEAPVPVLHVHDEKSIPGGAGNTILNLVSLGMEVVALGRVGDDPAGHDFIEAMRREGVETSGIYLDPSVSTPKKNRLMAGGQQLLRADFEQIVPLDEKLLSKVKEDLPKLLEDVSFIAISDYGKGFLSRPLLSSLFHFSMPTIVDPKGLDFSRYRGASLIKPNLTEAVAAAGLGEEASLDEIAAVLLEFATELMITRSERGISLFNEESGRQDFPAHKQEVRDVTGAGDTVLAVVTAALANDFPLQEAAHLANHAASLAIQKVGCARISLDQINKAVAKL